MGGQACVLYGAAEFSRDLDLLLDPLESSLAGFVDALKALQAVRVAVPPFRLDLLERGLAAHFRCGHPEAQGLRVDIMTRLREGPPFEELWRRRTSLQLGGQEVQVMSLTDLVQAKKTQRDKDWPMLRRLVEVHYFQNRPGATPEQIAFWLEELRTPELLCELVQSHPGACQRPAVLKARDGDLEEVERMLHVEQESLRARDRAYWAPLREELQRLRREVGPSGDPASELALG